MPLHLLFYSVSLYPMIQALLPSITYDNTDTSFHLILLYPILSTLHHTASHHITPCREEADAAAKVTLAGATTATAAATATATATAVSDVNPAEESEPVTSPMEI